ncbi:uncharacterized protein LOC110021690 [Phalaenopsis equestris]|uniref:uncharacterized protein LOC110021690 n=1 Tax=Phalaenopsis equestris TaxID=78828 RepID=UPI0009E2A91A|nr:uncharacterized protein LOC110021690 [Phalaenopsis equestris]
MESFGLLRWRVERLSRARKRRAGNSAWKTQQMLRLGEGDERLGLSDGTWNRARREEAGRRMRRAWLAASSMRETGPRSNVWRRVERAEAGLAASSMRETGDAQASSMRETEARRRRAGVPG